MDNSLEELFRIFSSGKITLVESEKNFTNDGKNPENLNTFFSNTVKKMKILEFEDFNPFAEKLSHPTLKAIFKYRKHRSMITINVTNK